ncbi:MAG: ATP-binding protein [Anaerolineales bacterium]|nr:ATP-binding protein [Anaerolineales bacterium]
MQIQIKSLEVKNCGPLRDVNIDFTTNGVPRPVTIIGGANGSGKTTILELVCALAHFALHEYVLLEHIDEDLMPPEMHILRRTKAAQMSLLIDGDNFNISWPGKSEQTPINSNKVKRFLETLNQQVTLELLTSFSSDELVSNQSLDLPSILYFPHYRRLTSIVGRQINREEVSYKWVYRYEIVSSFAGSLDSYLVWLDYAHPKEFNQIKKFLNQTVLVGKLIDKVDRPELTTMVKISNGRRHRLDELSSGEQNLLIIMLELRRRLLPGSIVLIDEIENSLHPAFQHRLAEALLKLQKQIPFQLIVTTHAPSFLDAFGAESTLLLTEF